MAATGYTPIQLYYSTTASAVPIAGNLANGELAINITDGKLYYKNNSGAVTLLSTAGQWISTGSDIYYNTGNVGIGTSSPTQKLQVAGAVRVSDAATEANALQLSSTSTTSTIETRYNYPLLFGTNATERMRLDTSGNLGLGVTPSAAAGFTTFDLSNATSGARIRLLVGSTPYGIFYTNGTTDVRLQTAASVPLLLGTNYNEYLRIAPSGAFGLSGANYGTSGQVLTSGGSGAAPTWTTVGGGSAATPTALGTVYGTTTAASAYNTGLGYSALPAITTGTNNVAIGRAAGNATTQGSSNVFVGPYAGTANLSGSGLVAVGNNALVSNTTGLYNIGVGQSTLNANTSGEANVAIGFQSLYSNTTGGNNIAIGYTAGYGLRTSGTVPGQNIAIGTEALYSASYASFNIGIGYSALRAAGDAGGGSVAIGQQAGRNCATPASSIFIGQYAAYTSTYWIGGICIGQAAGYSYNDPGTPYPGNFFVGDGAGRSVTTGTGNVMLGAGESGYSGGPGRNTTSGSQNTVLGTAAFTTNTTSSNSTAIGYATISNSTGANNTALGSYAGTYNGGSGGATTSGAGNTFLGCQTIAANATDSYNVIIGYAIIGKGNATGYISANGGSIYQGNNSSSWATTSDRRLKKNIVDNTVGLEKLTQIQVRNFEYRLPEEVDAELKPHDAINKSGVQIGVIAQELQAVLPDCVKQESTGVLSVDPDNLTWYMVNAIKELNAKIEAQAAEIAILKGQA